MTNENLVLLIPLILITAFSLILATIAWGRRSTPGAKTIVILLIAVFIWTFGYSIEIISVNLQQKIFWLNIEYIGILILPVAFLRFAIYFSRTKLSNEILVKSLSDLGGTLLYILVITNSAHQWFQTDQHIEYFNNVPHYAYTQGPIFWILNLFIYIHFLFSFVIILISFSPKNKLMRNQYIIVFLAAVPPLIGNLLHVFGLVINPLIDITPFAMFFSIIFVSLGFFKYKILDITPIGRNNLIDNMVDGVLVISPDNIFIDANNSFINSFEFFNKEMQGQNIKELFKNRPKIYHLLESHLSTKDLVSFLIEYKSVDYEVNISPLIDHNKRIIGQLFVFHDVTNELAIERANKEIEERYQLLVEQSPVAVGIHSEGKLVYVNQAGLDIFGATDEDKLLGKDINSLIHPDYLEASKERVRRSYFEKEIGEKIEEKMIRLDGQVIDVETMNHPIEYEGNPASQVILTDITDRKENSRKRQRQFNELSVLHTIANLGSKTNNEDELIEKATQIIGEIIYTDNFGLLMVENSVLIKEHHTYVQDKRENDILAFNFGEGVTGEVARTGVLLNVPDVSKRENYIPINPLISSELCVPIKINNEVVGLINAESNQLNAFSEEDELFISTLADQLAIVIEKIRLFKDIQKLATTDYLTGISNRRNFDELGKIEFERSKRYKNNLSAIIIDLDHFKKVNDTYGHIIGDKILQVAALKIKDQLRDIDILCRFGGEEFAVLFPQTTYPNTLVIAERILKAFNQSPIQTSKANIDVRVSIGVADLTKEDKNIKDLLEKADIALYQAKETGRNKVCVFNNE